MVDSFSDGVAHESKVGYVKYSRFVRKQILKDRALIKDPESGVNGAFWHFYRSTRTGKVGASRKVLRMLNRNRIRYHIYDHY